MITKKTLLSVAVFCYVLSLSSCTVDNNKEDEPNISPRFTPTEAVLRAFDSKYPYAENIEWSNNNTYYVVDFTESSKSINAWYKPSGEWMLSKTSVTAGGLGKKVNDALMTETFAEYEIESRSLLERKDFEDIYVLQAEKNSRTYSLYFSTEGDFIKTVVHDYNYVDSPVDIPATITDFVRDSYDNPLFLDLWYDSLGIKAGISESGTYKIVAFDSSALWICTIWDVEENSIPFLVRNSFKNSEYGSTAIQSTKIKVNDKELTYLFYFYNLEKGKQSVATLTEAGRFVSILSY